MHAPLFTVFNTFRKPAPVQGAKMDPPNRHTSGHALCVPGGALIFGPRFYIQFLARRIANNMVKPVVAF